MKKVLTFSKDVLISFLQDGCLYRASSLAFTSLLALVPLMAVGLVILSLFPPIQFIGKKIESFIFSNLVASSGETLEKYVSSFSQQVTQMSWVGIIALFVIVALLMFSIENTLNQIWKLPKRPGKVPILRAVGRHWLMLLMLPLFSGASLILSSYLSTLSFVRKTITFIDLPNMIFFVLPVILVFLSFVAIYKFIPATKVRFQSAVLSGLIATFFFEVSKSLFTLYIYFFPTYKILYGAFAAVPLFLLWVYIVWLIVLFGAEICYALDRNFLAS